MKKKLLSLFIVLVFVLTSFSSFTTSSGIAKASDPDPIVTVDQAVLDEMETKGSASYWVQFRNTADLTSAYSMSWSDRGWFVYKTLLAQAESTQAQVQKYLLSSKVDYKSYWINNSILVTSSSKTVLNDIMKFDGVESIGARKTYILYEPDTTAAVLDNGINAVEPNLTHVNADDVWALGIDGAGLVVANVDTGVRYTHQALVGQYRGNLGGGTFDHNYNWFNPDNLSDSVPRDGNGHGTHTMGTMVGDDGGANQIGIAPGAEWMACAGCPDGGCTDSALLGCGQFIAAPTDLTGNNANPDLRPNAVNNSWGDCGQTYDNWFAGVINAWHAVGTYPIFSNGNASNCGYPAPPGLNTVGNPARSGNVTGVGSSGEQNGQYATHSNWGPTDNPDTVNPVAPFDDLKPQVLAPGVSIRSSVPGSDTSYEDGWSGTSMSAPHVTGLVALIWQAAPCLVGDYAATETLIESTAVDMVYDDGSPNTPTNFPNYATGWGEIDALAAVNMASGMCAMGTLEGTVTTDGTTPLEGVKIFADSGAGYTKNIYTGADGTYSSGLPDGTYTLTATKYGYEEQTVSGVVVTEELTTVQDFVMPQLDMSLISGHIYDGGVEGLGAHGYPLYSSIRITTPGFDQTIYADPFTGYYEIEVVSDTELTFTTTPIPGGYDPLVESVTATGPAFTHDIYVPLDGEVCAAPGYQPDYDLFYSFEGGDEGFTPGGTTSFAWGDFTSGPMAGHSGTKGIATNPGGNYNPSELGWMASPVIDLSGNGTNTTAIQWWDWKHIESVSWDWARLDVTKDGGTTWITVWGPIGGVTDTAYSQQTVLLDASYNVSNFQFRFYFKSDTSVQYEGWYVDDIGLVSLPVPPPTTVFSTNFDSNNGGFTVSGTTSFAWGAPTSGPGAPYSAPNVWATNLSGDYNSNESGWITSPVINLSGYSTLAPTISFWHWNDIESTSYDWGAVEVTKDGGTTWTDVSGKIGDVSSWSPKSIQLDPSYSVSNFQFRFYFRSDSSVNYAGWYIDDVAVTVAEPVEIAAPCVVIPGGVVAGYVYDDQTDLPLVGADVYSDVVETQTFFIPEDPVSEGLFWVFQPTSVNPEDVEFTAEKALYGSAIETVTVEQDVINQQDFYLGTGQLTFDPDSFEVTMLMGDPALTETLTIGNIGTSDATFELVEKDEGFVLPKLMIPAFKGTLPEDTRPVSMGRAPEAANVSGLQSSEDNPFAGILAGEPAFAVDAYPGENLVYIPDTTAPGTWNVIGGVPGSEYFAGDFVGGDFTKLYVVNYTGNAMYWIDTTTAAATLIGTTTPPAGQTFSGLTGTPDGTMYGLTTTCSASNLVIVDIATAATTNLGALPGIGCGIDLAYNTNDDMIYIVDLITDSLFRVDPATMAVTEVGSLGVGANYAQGMDYEEDSGVLYWAAYTTAGELRIIDTTTGNSTLVGAFPGGAEVDSLAFATGGQSDVPWLSEDPVSGTVPAAGSIDVDVTFDPTGAGLSQPGNYLAEIKVKHETPYVYPNIPVVLHLIAPEDYGTFNGHVYGLEACDVNPAGLEGATINFWQDGMIKYTTTTNAEGYYSYAVPAGTYDIEVMADGYISQIVFDQEVLGQATVTVDFELRLEAPCISVDPTSLEQTQVTDTITTQTLTIINTGAGDGVFELMEIDGGYQPPAESHGGKVPSYHYYPEKDLPGADKSKSTPLGKLALSHESILPTDILISEGFEGAFPPTDWTQVINNASKTWTKSDLYYYEGLYGAYVPWDYNQDEWLLTPELALAEGTLSLYSQGSIYWCRDTYDNCDLNVWLVVGDVGGGDDVFVKNLEEDWSGNWTWAQATIDLASYLPGVPVRIGFQLIGDDDADVAIDYVTLDGVEGLDVPWLSEDPAAGVVPADGSLDVTITYDSTGLALGDYFAAIRVKNPPAAAINVPVTLHVTELRNLYLPLILR